MNLTTKIDDMDSGQKNFLSNIYDESLSGGTYSLCEELDLITERYITLEKLATGGMKEIYICEDKSTGRSVAKALLKDKAKESAIEDFLREARVTASLQHPNIIPIHDIGKDELGQPFFTMKLIEGQNLAEFIEEQGSARNLNECLDILIKICDAVAFAHSNGVLHLDLKPENIQVSHYGEVLLCDWGLARIVGAKIKEQRFESYMLNEDLGENLTIDGFIKGSPGYMAPEQINTKLDKKDERTDIYALGALLYYLITGQATVSHKDPDFLKKTLQGDIPLPSELCNVPESLETICLKAIEPKKENRYQTANCLIVDLRAYLNGFSPTSEKASFLKQFKLFYKRNNRACITALLFLLVLATSGVFYTLEIKASQQKAESALSSLQQANIEKSKLYDELQQKIINSAHNAYQNSAFTQAENMLAQIDTPEVVDLKIKLNFIFQRFDIVQDLLGDDKESNIAKATQMFRASVKNGKLSTKALLKFNSEYNLDRILKVNFLTYHLRNYSHQEEKLILVPALIKTDNNIKDLNYKYKILDDGISVDISNNLRLRKYQWIRFFGNVTEINISNTSLQVIKALNSLPLKKVNAANTPINSINWLSSLKLEELDIRGTLVESLFGLKSMNSLKLLILPSNFPKENLLDYSPPNAKILFLD
ncbi:MAG: protein kinase [Lentisphaeraceae bacterium]|nr:protein kinase [Lentisphaeraceae bacterium]